MTDNEAPKARRRLGRSPSFPYVNLEKAIQMAQTIEEKERGHPCVPTIALQHLGLSPKGSAGMRTLAALKSFGLYAVEGESIKLTELGNRIVNDHREYSVERDQAIKEAALSPPIYEKMWKAYKNDLPSPDSLHYTLTWEWGFNKNSVDYFVKEYKATVSFAKLDEYGKNVTGTGEIEEEGHEPDVGDYVQWVSQDAYQFPKAKRLRGFSRDGAIAFVEGENTGFPRGELERAEVPPEDLSEQNRRPLQKVNQPMDSGLYADVLGLEEGQAAIEWPRSLSSDSYYDFRDWLELLRRRAARSAGIDPEGDSQVPDSESDSERGRQE